MTPSTDDRQLSFAIAPALAGREPATVLNAEVKLKGSLHVATNLDHGDELVVTVTGADGEVLAQHRAEVSKPPTFEPIVDRGDLLGYTRVHTAAIGDRT